MQAIKMFFVFATLLQVTSLIGCASNLIGNREGSERVSLADANQVRDCQSKGKTVVSVLAKVGFINRLEDIVEGDLYQLARNDAVDAGADTLVKGESQEFGKRTYELYKCRP